MTPERRVCLFKMVEAGGVEPPSENIPREASTGLCQELISPRWWPLTGRNTAISPVTSSRKTPVSTGLRQPDKFRRSELSGMAPNDATAWAVYASLFLGSVSVVVIVVGNYFGCRFFTRPAAPRPAAPVSTSPSKPVRPHIGWRNIVRLLCPFGKTSGCRNAKAAL